MMQVIESLPKRICSKCGSGQFHTWDESHSDLMGTSTTYNIWIQCNQCDHRSILSTKTTIVSAKSGIYYSVRMPEKPEFETF